MKDVTKKQGGCRKRERPQMRWEDCLKRDLGKASSTSLHCTHTDPLFAMTKLIKLEDLYKYRLGIFMHKVTHSQLPQNMSSMFLRTDKIHSHKLRNQNAYYIQQIRTNTRKSTINLSDTRIAPVSCQHPHSHTRTNSRTHSRTHTHMYAHIHTHARTHAHTHARMHACTHTR